MVEPRDPTVWIGGVIRGGLCSGRVLVQSKTLVFFCLLGGLRGWTSAGGGVF